MVAEERDGKAIAQPEAVESVGREGDEAERVCAVGKPPHNASRTKPLRTASASLNRVMIIVVPLPYLRDAVG